jgi:hypothetical protein
MLQEVGAVSTAKERVKRLTRQRQLMNERVRVLNL